MNITPIKPIALACVFACTLPLSATAAVHNVQITATDSTNYGIDTVATMYSEVQTAADGLATYQIAFDVTAPSGSSVSSGASGGTATTSSWGIGEDALFLGTDSEYAELSNLRITNFSANGGDLTIDDFKGLSFTNVNFNNAQSPNKDAVIILANGTALNDLANLATNPAAINVETLEGVVPSVKTLHLEVGESTNQDKNKWAVDSVEVTVEGDAIDGRAGWMRGSWGINWKPVNVYGGKSEQLTINQFITQIEDLKTIDYVQLHLGESSIKSSVHIAPLDILESLWQGDTDEDGNFINLTVPRASSGVDPFLDMLVATKAAGLKTQIYINSSNMLRRVDDSEEDGYTPNPDYLPNITERWKELCDTDEEIQAFLNSQSYHFSDEHPERQYMFAYAEFVLKVYSERYGDLIDAWLFDTGEYIDHSGDHSTSGEKEEQTLYGAFAKAARAGNPHAPVSFNNGPERDTEESNPFSEATHYDDYMFGHPYNGGRNMGNHDNGLYDRNYAHIQKMTETNGNVHSGNEVHDWDFDDKVVGHFDPPMSTTSWNGGNTAALTDEEFTLWNLEATQAGGAMTWGVPLVAKSGLGDDLLIRDWGMAQLEVMDEHLSFYQEAGAPNWARADTPLPSAEVGVAYLHSLVEGVDFWDPEGNAISMRILDIADGAPSWLTIEEDSANPGTWILQGTPSSTAKTNNEFRLEISDASGTRTRWVELAVTGTSDIVSITKRNASGFALHGGEGGANAQNVELMSYSATDVNQQWLEIDRGNGYYSYQKLDTNFCIDGGNDAARNQNVYLWTCSDTSQNQQWEKVEVTTGYFRLQKRNASDYTINGGGGGADQQNVNLYETSYTSHNLDWSIVKVN
ncbi:RICIN domain-containing protein [Shewanella sp. 10N.7]|uniref:RICIN domain-containing protein n=1 Tax=Shewanella sp. 10N.7 TaxID=2885093 RepID=UPI001E3C1A4C|nr:RICIN domain-containing protein [Shewanella sp. 10N.7]MCC4831803.1 RICIN domain-containing protein [Shewanella sp. 10N.7]